MSSTWRRSPFVVAALTLLALSGCENVDPVSGPGDEPAQTQSIAELEASVVSAAQANGIEPMAPAPAGPVLRSGGNNREFVFVQGVVGDAAVEAVIGSGGGVLNLGDHWLLVPQNAVRGNVRFRMTPISDGTLHVDLSATHVQRSGTERENDVGRAGFRRPVFLAFHFGDAPIDPSRFMIAWLTNGTLVTQQTFIYEQEWAVGVLRHFSGYVLVAN